MGIKLQTIKDIRLYLAKELKDNYDDRELSSIANIIIKTIIGVTRLHQLYMTDYVVTNEQSEKILKICLELKTEKPIQYVLGETVFYDCKIRLNNSTLIPRPETEELVDLIIRENVGYTGNIIDFGTGSGCIAIALASKLTEANLTGIDILTEAIDIARENAILNNLKVSFIKGDILNFDYNAVEKAGILVSNPPYIRESEKNHMSFNVLGFEPHSALFVPDTDPLIYYRAILRVAEKILRPGGKIYFEINEAMATQMVKLFELFGYSEVRVIRDLNGKERIIKGEKYV